MSRPFLTLIGLFCAITAVMMITGYRNPDATLPGVLAESFYYTAIAFAVYHLVNKSRQNRSK